MEYLNGEKIDEDLPVKSQRDAGSYIGNKEEPTEQDTGEEDIKKPKKERKQKPLSFLIPAEGVIFDSMDIAVTIRVGGHKYQQLVEGLPLIKTE